MLDFGKKLKELRKEKGLTQQELAAMIGVHVMSIRRYEAGTRVPGMDECRKLADALNVELFSDGHVIGFRNRELEKQLNSDIKPHNGEDSAYNEYINGYDRVRGYPFIYGVRGREVLVAIYDRLNMIGQNTAVQEMQRLTAISEFTKKLESIPEEE